MLSSLNFWKFWINNFEVSKFDRANFFFIIIQNAEAVDQRYSVKNVLLKTSQNLQENTCVIF